ncbi:MAG: hypothetical protein ACKVKT_03160 [Rhodospirillales bacterium]
MGISGNVQKLTADGTTTFKTVVGPIAVSVNGTFGGGTAKVVRKDHEGVTVDIPLATDTANYSKVLDYPNKTLNEIAVNLAGATTPDIDITIQGLVR